MISAPAEGRKMLSHYDEEEYCKHLIGNGKSSLVQWYIFRLQYLSHASYVVGWSVPVVEHILKGINEMYPSKNFFRQYQGFNYIFPWPRKYTQ